MSIGFSKQTLFRFKSGLMTFEAAIEFFFLLQCCSRIQGNMHEKSDTPPSELAAKIHPVSTGNDGRNKHRFFCFYIFLEPVS